MVRAKIRRHPEGIGIFRGYDVTLADFTTAAWFMHPSPIGLPKKVWVFVGHIKEVTCVHPATAAVIGMHSLTHLKGRRTVGADCLPRAGTGHHKHVSRKIACSVDSPRS
jgi:hypothetical protein